MILVLQMRRPRPREVTQLVSCRGMTGIQAFLAPQQTTSLTLGSVLSFSQEGNGPQRRGIQEGSVSLQEALHQGSRIHRLGTSGLSGAVGMPQRDCQPGNPPSTRCVGSLAPGLEPRLG